MRVLLISTYEMGRQPFGLASPAAWLRAAGHEVACVDVSRTRLDEAAIAGAHVVGFYLPMHTATRLALPIIERVRALNPSARLCCYGLYAPLNEALLKTRGVETILGGEFEEELCALVGGTAAARAASWLPKLTFRVPDRSDLPPLSRYATLETPSGRRLVAYTEASRGCSHLCRHCPIVPVYDGRFRVVQPDVVVADIRQQIAAGARHVTFGDPDFFNAPTHGLRIVRALADEHPGLTYDVTIKIEHLLQHREHLETLAATGCLFVTSAVESVDDVVLGLLDKGHTRDDFILAVDLCRAVGLTLSPTFVSFTPWTTLDGYCDLLDAIEDLDLADHVAPIQFAIRLLICDGSRLRDLGEIRELAPRFDPVSLAYPWRHPDPRVDALQQEVAAVIGRRLSAPRRETFERIRALAFAHAHRGVPRRRLDLDLLDRAAIPYLNEPWYC